MSATVIYLPEAEADVDTAYRRYEQRQNGLGGRFLERLRICIATIADNPELYAVLRDEIRAAPLRRFPYVVYYRAGAGSVFVLAVLHGHQDPQTWMRRA